MKYPVDNFTSVEYSITGVCTYDIRPPTEVPVVPRLANMNGYSTATTWLVLNRGGTQYGGTRNSSRAAPSGFRTWREKSRGLDEPDSCHKVKDISDYYTWTRTRMPTDCRPMALIQVLNKMLADSKAMIEKYTPDYDRFYSAYKTVYRKNMDAAFNQLVLQGDHLKCSFDGQPGECPKTPVNEPGLAHSINVISYSIPDHEGWKNMIEGKYRFKEEWINFSPETIPVLRKEPGEDGGTSERDFVLIEGRPRLYLERMVVPNPRVNDTSVLDHMAMNLNDAKWSMAQGILNASDAQAVWNFEPQVRQIQEIAKALRDVAMQGADAEKQLQQEKEKKIQNIISTVFGAIAGVYGIVTLGIGLVAVIFEETAMAGTLLAIEQAAMRGGVVLLAPALEDTIFEMTQTSDPSDRFGLIAPWIGGLGMGVRMFGPKTIPRQGIANIAQESSAFVDKMKPGSLKSDSQLSRDLLFGKKCGG
jgi:hypothetical protein